MEQNLIFKQDPRGAVCLSESEDFFETTKRSREPRRRFTDQDTRKSKRLLYENPSINEKLPALVFVEDPKNCGQ